MSEQTGHRQRGRSSRSAWPQGCVCRSWGNMQCDWRERLSTPSVTGRACAFLHALVPEPNEASFDVFPKTSPTYGVGTPVRQVPP